MRSLVKKEPQRCYPKLSPSAIVVGWLTKRVPPSQEYRHAPAQGRFDHTSPVVIATVVSRVTPPGIVSPQVSMLPVWCKLLMQPIQ